MGVHEFNDGLLGEWRERAAKAERVSENLAARVAELEAALTKLEAVLKTAKERQREACARTAQTEATGATKCEGGPEFIAAAVRATPLVTENAE